MLSTRSPMSHSLDSAIAQLQSRISTAGSEMNQIYKSIEENNESLRISRRQQESSRENIQKLYLKAKETFERAATGESKKLEELNQLLKPQDLKAQAESVFQDFTPLFQSFQTKKDTLNTWDRTQIATLESKIKTLESQISQNPFTSLLTQVESAAVEIEESIGRKHLEIDFFNHLFLNLYKDLFKEVDAFIELQNPTQTSPPLAATGVPDKSAKREVLEKIKMFNECIERNLTPEEINEILKNSIPAAIDLKKAKAQFKNLFEEAFLGKELSPEKKKLLETSCEVFSNFRSRQETDCLCAQNLCSDPAWTREITEQALTKCIVVPSKECEYELYQFDGPNGKKMNKTHDQIKKEIQKAMIQSFIAHYILKESVNERTKDSRKQSKPLPIEKYLSENFIIVVNRNTQIGIALRSR